MKFTIPFLAFFLSVTAFAADPTLTDGRVLKDATIISQTPRTVTIKHASGLGSIAKSLLPSELKTKYPVDESAALVADQKAAEARLAAQEYQKREAARAAADRSQQTQQSKTDSAEPPINPIKTMARIKANASNLATNYFSETYSKYGNNTHCYVTITEVAPIGNWPGHWRVTGEARITTGDSYGYAEDSSPIGDATWRRQYEDNQTNSLGYVPRPLRAETSYERSMLRTGSASTERKQFEAIYSEEGAKPSLDIRAS